MARWVFRFLAVIALAYGSLAAAETRYYMTVFGSMGNPDHARSSHTWGTFVAVSDGRLVAEHTISWLPAPGHFGDQYTMPPLATVPGRNYTLDETLAMTRIRRVMHWGPFEITRSLYERAVRRVEFLGRPGATRYKMFVLRPELRAPALHNQPGGVINCIMALSDLGGGPLDTGTRWGFEASRMVLGFLARPHEVRDYPWGERQEVARLMRLRERIGR